MENGRWAIKSLIKCAAGGAKDHPFFLVYLGSINCNTKVYTSGCSNVSKSFQSCSIAKEHLLLYTLSQISSAAKGGRHFPIVLERPVTYKTTLCQIYAISDSRGKLCKACVNRAAARRKMVNPTASRPVHNYPELQHFLPVYSVRLKSSPPLTASLLVPGSEFYNWEIIWFCSQRKFIPNCPELGRHWLSANYNFRA